MIDDCCNRYPHDAQCPYAPEEPEITCEWCNREPDYIRTDEEYDEPVGCEFCLPAEEAYGDICPECGQEAEEFYITETSGEIHSCDNCTKTEHAYEVMARLSVMYT